MTRALTLLTAALAVVHPSATARAAEPAPALDGAPRRSAPKEGHVTYVTRERAFLDCGARCGLQVGETLALARNARLVTTCQLDQVAFDAASCLTGQARLGDAFAVRAAPAPQDTPPVPAGGVASGAGASSPAATAPFAPLPPGELEGVRDALEREPYALVDEGATHPQALRTRVPATLTIGHDAYFTATRDNTRFSRERVEVSLRGVPTGLGNLRASADASAWYWTENSHEKAQLLVWQLEASSREADQPVALAFGRLWPVGPAGVRALDGAQGGWHYANLQHTFEVGALGGALPDPLSLAPRPAEWLAGAYLTHSFASDTQGLLRFSREAARVAARHLADGTTRGDADLDLRLGFGPRFDLALAGQVSTTPALERASASLVTRPSDAWRLQLSGRRVGKSSLDALDLGRTAAMNEAITTADVDVQWSAAPWLVIAAAVDGAQSDVTGHNRVGLGPDLTWPTLLGRFGSLSVGYREELGWLAGRSVSTQLVSVPAQSWRTLVRIAYYEDHGTKTGAGPTQRDLSLFVHGDFALASALAVRASALTRVSLDGDRGGPLGAALVAQLSLVATAW